jgi:hypothetical protein
VNSIDVSRRWEFKVEVRPRTRTQSEGDTEAQRPKVRRSGGARSGKRSKRTSGAKLLEKKRPELGQYHCEVSDEVKGGVQERGRGKVM